MGLVFRGMTLVIALVWGEGVLVSSDSRASVGPVYHEERKIKPIYFRAGDKEIDLAIAGGAGDAVLVKQGFQLIEAVFRDWFERVGSRESRNPYSSEFIDIVSTIESRLMTRYSELRGVGIEPSVNLLLATVTMDRKPMLYVFDERGLAEPLHDNPGYALLGKGMVTGGLLLLRLLDYSPGEAWTWDLGLLTAFIIDMVSEIDPSVSPFLGESYLIRYDKELDKIVLGPLRTEVYREYKDKVRLRKKLFKLLWSVAEEVGEETIMDTLKNLLGKER